MGSKKTADELLGVEIAGNVLRAAAVRRNANGYAVRACARALPEGSVVSDFLVAADEVVEALREALGELGVRSAKTTLVLSGERTACRVERLAVEDDRHALAGSEERLRRYVAFAGKPIAIARAFQRASEGETHAGRLISAATPEALLEHHVAIARRCGLAVARAEPGLTAAARAVIAAHADPEPRFLLVAAGSRCQVGILRAGKLIFTCGLRLPEDEEAGNGAWLLNTLDRLQEYHLRHANGPSLVQELLCCGTLEPVRSALAVAAKTGLRVRELDPSELPEVEAFEVCGTARVATATGAEFFPAVAGALAERFDLEDFRPLNLLPPPEKRRARALLAPWVLVPAVVVFALTCGLLTWDWVVRREADRLTYLMTHPSPQMLEAARLQFQESELKERARNIEELLELSRQQPPDQLLRELARCLPSEAWLERLALTHEGRCLVRGTAREEDAVFALASALRRSPVVKDVRIARTGNTREAGMILTDFSLEVELAPAAPPPEQPGQEVAAGRLAPKQPPGS